MHNAHGNLVASVYNFLGHLCLCRLYDHLAVRCSTIPYSSAFSQH